MTKSFTINQQINACRLKRVYKDENDNWVESQEDPIYLERSNSIEGQYVWICNIDSSVDGFYKLQTQAEIGDLFIDQEETIGIGIFSDGLFCGVPVNENYSYYKAKMEIDFDKKRIFNLPMADGQSDGAPLTSDNLPNFCKDLSHITPTSINFNEYDDFVVCELVWSGLQNSYTGIEYECKYKIDTNQSQTIQNLNNKIGCVGGIAIIPKMASASGYYLHIAFRIKNGYSVSNYCSVNNFPITKQSSGYLINQISVPATSEPTIPTVSEINTLSEKNSIEFKIPESYLPNYLGHFEIAYQFINTGTEPTVVNGVLTNFNGTYIQTNNRKTIIKKPLITDTNTKLYITYRALGFGTSSKWYNLNNNFYKTQELQKPLYIYNDDEVNQIISIVKNKLKVSGNYITDKG